MSGKKYKNWDIEELTDEIIIYTKVGLEARPQQVKLAAEKIAAISESGITKRANRIARKRFK